MPTHRLTRLAIMAVLIIGLVFGTARVTALSAAHASRFVSTSLAAGAARQGTVPFGWISPDGSGVEVRKLPNWTALRPGEGVGIRNVSSQSIVGLRLVVIAFVVPPTLPVRIFTSNLEAVAISPGETHEVSSNVAAGAFPQLASLGARVQGVVSVQEIRFANGSVWQMTPNPAATNGLEALGSRPTPLASDLIGAPPPPNLRPGLCADQFGKTYSFGAVVEVLNQPGRLARCTNARWAEYQAAGTVSLRLEIIRNGVVIGRPTIRTTIGDPASVALNDAPVVSITPTELLSNGVRVDFKAGNETARPVLIIRDQAESVSFRSGSDSFEWRLSVIQ